jgi:nicotinate-nucleotide pyrophosphorylase (carboxylating)
MKAARGKEDRVPDDVADVVARALAEDLGDGDRNAAIVPAEARAAATVTAREGCVLAGRPWFDAVFAQIDDAVRIDWRADDGDTLRPETVVCELEGAARSLLSGERTALNFLQMLSGVATTTRRYVNRIKGTGAAILDTRKTLPGLRSAQKYAVRCGGGVNHRSGLFDAILIKENHIVAAGSITTAVAGARRLHGDLFVQVEVETLAELEEALAADVDAVLLDNFANHILTRAVLMCRRHRRPDLTATLIEVSGDVDLGNVRGIADTGVDRISIGALTKHVTAVDLSMRLLKSC